MCVRVCLCNSCFKKETCTDCKYNADHKDVDCCNAGIQKCKYYIERKY